MMHWGWYAGALLFMAADWLAVGFSRPRMRVVTKPAGMLILIAGFTSVNGWLGDGAWFGLGLVFSLLGDILLILAPSLFPAGLAAFLMAHLTYIIGFNQSLVLPDWRFLFPVGVLIILDSFGYRRLRASILCQPKGRWVRYPVLAYMVVISLMLFSSLLTWLKPDWPNPSAALVSVGALLFYVSDTTLAFNRFCQPIRYGRVIVIVSYHLAQIAIASGVLLR